MAVELEFQRNNPKIPWGFRLTGGADLDIPLTVVKVSEDSLAEKYGMKVGDLLVRINDTPTAGLTHLQAHDLIKNSGDGFIAAVIRGELPEHFTVTEESFDSETTQNGMSQSLQINIKTNIVDTTKIIVESDSVIGQNITVNGSVNTDEEDQNEKISQQVVTETMSQVIESTSKTEENKEENIETKSESEVMKAVKNVKQNQEHKWTTFLQKPNRPKPKIKQKEPEEPKPSSSDEITRDEHCLFTRLLCVLQEPPYRVMIQKQKRKRDEEKAKELLATSSQESTPIPEEFSAQTPELTSEQEQELIKKLLEADEEEMRKEEENKADLQEDNQLEEKPVVSEIEMSLEEQLSAIQRQLLALSQLPATIQQTLDAVTQQLTKIVGPIDDPNKEENVTEDFQDNSLEDAEFYTEEKTEGLETLEEVSESGLDRDSQEEFEKYHEHPDADIEDDNKTEPELEMLQVTPEPSEEELTPEERELRKIMEKKQKVAHWNDIWPWGDHLGRKIYRDANTHLVPSKAIQSNKINFLKYQPLPKTLDHLKQSEVYKMIHEMDEPVRGVAARPGKAMAEEDYYNQIRNQEGQTKG